MAVKVNLGVSKKVGLPEYGSAGASCNLELEVSLETLESDLDGFHRKVRAAFVAAQQAVQDQLLRVQAGAAGPPRAVFTDDRVRPPVDGDGHAATDKPTRVWGTAARPGGPAPRGQRPATTGQVRAVYGIARQAGVDLDELLAEQGVARVEELTARAASGLIDRLKAEVTV